MDARRHIAGLARVRRMLGICAAAAAICLSAPAAVCAGVSDIYVAPVLKFIDDNVTGWIHDPVIISALKEQNLKNRTLTQPQIDTLDREWVRETNSAHRPMIDSAMATPLSRFLKQKEEEAMGAITEIIVMDAFGLNAGQSSVTSDYWQGDEDKFIKSYGAGPMAVFVDSAREATQMLQSQVSMTIVDEDGKPIGAITIGVNLDQL